MSSLILYQRHISLQNSETDRRNLEKQQLQWLEPASFKLERWTKNRDHDLPFRILSPVRETYRSKNAKGHMKIKNKNEKQI